MIRKIDNIFDELIEAIERGFDISSGYYGESESSSVHENIEMVISIYFKPEKKVRPIVSELMEDIDDHDWSCGTLHDNDFYSYFVEILEKYMEEQVDNI